MCIWRFIDNDPWNPRFSTSSSKHRRADSPAATRLSAAERRSRTRRCRRASQPSPRRSCASVSPVRPRRHLPREALRDRRRDLRRRRGRRVFVPLNPLLKPEQVALHPARLQRARARHVARAPGAARRDRCRQCPDLRHVVVVDAGRQPRDARPASSSSTGIELLRRAAPARSSRRSTPTWRRSSTRRAAPASPKGVVLSHRNMVAGAKSVASLSREPCRRHAARGAAAVVRRRLQPAHDRVPRRRARRAAQLPAAARRAQRAASASGSPASPPCRRCTSSCRSWSGRTAIGEHLRYFANTGGRMPRETLNALRQRAAEDEAVPDVRPDRGVPLDLPAARGGRPPARLDRQGDPECRDPGAARGRHASARPTSRASSCTAARWSAWATGTIRRRPPSATSRCRGREAGLVLPEIAVFSGDTVRTDAEGFLYFIGRRDEMIKTSGYRVSPTEVEEVLYATQLVGEVRRVRRAAPDARARRSSSSRRRRPTARARRGSAARRSAASGCRPTWCRRASTCAPGRCRATRTARSTARRWRAEFEGAVRGQSTHDDARPRHAPMTQFRGRRRLPDRRRHAADRARRARRPHAFLCLRPRAASTRAWPRCAPALAARRSSCTTR